LNKEVNYLSSLNDVELLPKVIDAVNIFKEYGYKIFIITNQSGIAKGIIEEKMLILINNKLINLLGGKSKIDDIFYCPHDKSENCNCRKPKPGLITNASKKYNIDLNKSYIIGDKLIDIETGINAGCKTILVSTGYGKTEKYKITNFIKPNFIVNDLYDAAILISGKAEYK